MLPPNEIEKDHYQVKTAASKLLASLQAVKDSSLNTQMQRIRTLLHSQPYAYEMAAFMSAGHPAGQQEEESGPQPAKDSGFVKTTARDQKIATNLAGFYALECALNYVVSTKNLSPKTILQSITSNSIDEEDKTLFSRFANATWKASQPFRGLARIERETFAPFYFLNEADIEKDWVQIKSAAATVLQALPQ
ncbi:MAG TPA: hypothetical protein VL307_20280, partial [Chitinophagaceae bacterium]|nr:hypothetical protein [Chitinophagaceae bacterium]